MNIIPQTDQSNLSWSIPVTIDWDQDRYLHHSKDQDNRPEEELIPRQLIAEAVGSSRLQAELGRPILVGLLHTLPAFLLRTRFTFQRLSTSMLYRIQMAEVKLVFNDASVVGKEMEQQKHPSIGRFYPLSHEGKAFSSREVSTQMGISLSPSSQGLSGGLNMSRCKTYVSFTAKWEHVGSLC
jgi:hypothetical protein